MPVAFGYRLLFGFSKDKKKRGLEENLYRIGTLLNVDRMEGIVDKWGHILRVTPKDIHKANAWFH